MLADSNRNEAAAARQARIKEIRDWVDVFFKIILTLAGVYVGYYFSFQKQQNEDIKLIVDLLTAQDSARRQLGNLVAQEYYVQERVPKAIYVAIVGYANNTDDKSLQAAVNAGAAQAIKQQPELKAAIAKALDSLPPRVYLHIRNETDRGMAERVRSILEDGLLDGRQISVPGIERIAGAQSKTLLKCFRQAECETSGAKLAEMLRSQGIAIELSNQSAVYGKSTSIRPDHFEIWFASGDAGQDQK